MDQPLLRVEHGQLWWTKNIQGTEQKVTNTARAAPRFSPLTLRTPKALEKSPSLSQMIGNLMPFNKKTVRMVKALMSFNNRILDG